MGIKDHSERKMDSEDHLVSWEGRGWHFMHSFSESIVSLGQGFSRNGLKTTWDACENAGFLGHAWDLLGHSSLEVGLRISLLSSQEDYAVNHSCKEAADFGGGEDQLVVPFPSPHSLWFAGPVPDFHLWTRSLKVHEERQPPISACSSFSANSDLTLEPLGTHDWKGDTERKELELRSRREPQSNLVKWLSRKFQQITTIVLLRDSQLSSSSSYLFSPYLKFLKHNFKWHDIQI